MSLNALAGKALDLLESHPRPLYRIEVDGKDITAGIQGRLVSLSLTDNPGFEADILDLQLDDSDGRLDLPPRGAEIRVAIGWPASGLVDKGSYTVDDVEHNGAPDILTIRARSADLRAGLTTQRERSWHDVKLRDIVCTIASECGLQPAIGKALGNEHIDHIDQTNESGANLLTRLARMFDAIATVKNKRLVFIPAAGGVSVGGKALAPISITREVGDNHRFSIADRESYTAVRAQYNDVGAAVKGEVIWSAEEDAAERQIPAKVIKATPTTGQYKDAGQVFKSRTAAQRAAHKQWQALKANKAARAAWIGVKAKYDDRNLGVSGEVTYGQADEDAARAHARKLAAKDASANTANANAFDHSADNIKTLRHVYATKENAKRAARAEWRRLQRGLATFNIILARGRPELFPEVPATVRGWKRQIDSTDWSTTKVIHNLNDNGFTTTVDMEIKATEIPG